MHSSPPARRLEEDRCPGILRLAESADGALARIRLPGGRASSDAWRALAQASEQLGNGQLELTSRGNVQLRGLAPEAGAALSGRLADAGLLPCITHERVRNIVASPLAGIDTRFDLGEVVEALDAAICAERDAARLSGRFLFGIDDGRGDIAALAPDVLAVIPATGEASVSGLLVQRADAAEVMLACALAFLDVCRERDLTAWRVADIADAGPEIQRRVAAHLGLGPSSLPVVPRQTRPAGRIDQAIGGQAAGGQALCVVAPLGRLTAAQAAWLAEEATGRATRVTPWRSVVVPDVSHGARARALAAGLAVDPSSPWLNVSACTGRPGCAQALADVHEDATAGATRWPGRRVHWSGCSRRCGRPAGTEVDVVATTHGYDIEHAGVVDA